MKKFYIWYKENWLEPKRLAIFKDLDDFVDFISITCTNRGYEVYDISIDEIEEDDDADTDDYEKKFCEQYVKAKQKIANQVKDFCYKIYRESEEKYVDTGTLDDNALRAAAWRMYENIDNEGEKDEC